MNRKSWLTKPVALYVKTGGSVHEGRAMDAVYLDFSKAFDAIFCNIHIGKLMKYRPDKWTLGLIEKWLNSWDSVGCGQWREV